MTLVDPALVIDSPLPHVLRAIRARLSGPRSQVGAVIRAVKETHQALVGYGSDYAGHTAANGPYEATVKWRRQVGQPSIQIDVYRKVRT